ncbi:MAG: RNA polymerase subunit sigma-70 [Acidobacteriota bacterium]|nr:RNA polymerase subunit sigma-70 [Acidobacteriota bacterium]
MESELSPGGPDDRDFTGLVERHRAELHAHCYRMLGSVFDADDALQETLVRAWRGAEGLRQADSARAWLYRIATNVCLTELERRRRRVLPHDFGPPAEASTPPGEPIVEAAWIEPYPDAPLGLPAGRAAPAASYEQHEAIELAFVAALQHLAPNQRAVLLLREVLGFSAEEAATLLETTVPSVTSALQRARAAVRERVPARTQQANLRALGDRALGELVERYVSAWERVDVDAFVSLLAEDASFAMPPLRTWYSPRATIDTWARATALSGAWRWRAVPTRANAQPALGFYAYDPSTGSHLPFALNVLTLREDGRVSDVTAFIVRAPDPAAAHGADYSRFPDRPVDERGLTGAFSRFGLPERLD